MKWNLYIVLSYLVTFGACAEMLDVIRLYNHKKVDFSLIVVGCIMTPFLLWCAYLLYQKGKRMQKPF